MGILGNNHITINPYRRGKCTKADADEYTRGVKESSVMDLLKNYKMPVKYWQTLTIKQKEAYDYDFAVFKKQYRRSVVEGMIIVLIAVLISIGAIIYAVSLPFFS